MSKPRSIQRHMARRQVQQDAAVELPPGAQLPPGVQPNPLEGKDYRVRRLILKAELDVYNPQGALENRGLTDDLVIPEAEFPPALVEYFVSRGILKDGFKTYAPVPPKE